MKKKIFKIKISTILQFFLCLVLAFIIWFFVQYSNTQGNAGEDENDATALFSANVDSALRL